jgi:predicted GIY-YIG superfamily endonuclease
LRLHHGEQAQWNALHRRDQRFAGSGVSASREAEDFTKKHGRVLLAWYEAYEDLDSARLRELQMKKWNRAWKIELIERDNPQWKDLYGTLFG